MHLDMVGNKREFPRDGRLVENSETSLAEGDIIMQNPHKRRFLKTSGSKNDIEMIKDNLEVSKHNWRWLLSNPIEHYEYPMLECSRIG